MLTAYLYIRVSTDEQARKGYSLLAQEERLQGYCVANNIQAIKTIEEDYSAMTFDRPAWTKLMAELNRYKSKRPDFILFTRWDRFSRNAADAYYVIRLLSSLVIEPQAIDQPLDLTVPENKLMLAMYIAIAEVENDRRILNVKQSIRKARQEGRWTSHAPLGYSYQLLEGRCGGIIPKEPEASLIKEAFRVIATEIHRTVESVYQEMVKLGLKCGHSQFWRILRNKVYCGMVKVPTQKDQDAYWIKGIHEALISEPLFKQVQQILSRRKKSPVVIGKPNEKLFLRGFLCCPKCGKRLTGSGSKGRHARYYYYHCVHPCNFRFRADMINQLFLNEIRNLSINSRYLELYQNILKMTRKELFAEQSITQKSLLNTINSFIERILHARELTEKGELTIDEFKTIKSGREQKISVISSQLQQSVFLVKKNKKNLAKAVAWLSDLSSFFASADSATKASLLRAIFDNNRFRLDDSFHFSEGFCFATQSIFDIKITSRPSLDNHCYRNPIVEERYYKIFLQKVIEIECQKGNDINRSQAQAIVGFLTDIASIIVKKF